MSKLHEHRFLPCMGQSLNCGTFFYVLFLKKIVVQLIYNVVLVSNVQHSDLVMHTRILYSDAFPLQLIQNIEYSSLCYTVVDLSWKKGICEFL